MAKKPLVSPSQRAYMERYLTAVELKRARPGEAADIERILADMQSEDELTRANAVRQIGACLCWPGRQRPTRTMRGLGYVLGGQTSPVSRAS